MDSIKLISMNHPYYGLELHTFTVHTKYEYECEGYYIQFVEDYHKTRVMLSINMEMYVSLSM